VSASFAEITSRSSDNEASRPPVLQASSSERDQPRPNRLVREGLHVDSFVTRIERIATKSFWNPLKKMEPSILIEEDSGGKLWQSTGEPLPNCRCVGEARIGSRNLMVEVTLNLTNLPSRLQSCLIPTNWEMREISSEKLHLKLLDPGATLKGMVLLRLKPWDGNPHVRFVTVRQPLKPEETLSCERVRNTSLTRYLWNHNRVKVEFRSYFL
jgi:hypothetical protein